MQTLGLRPIGRVHMSAFLLVMGQDERSIASVIGGQSFDIIKGHVDFPALVEHYEKRRGKEDFALSALRGLALANLLRWMASDQPTASVRCTLELLDRISLPSLSGVAERIATDGGDRLTLVEERRTLELTGISNEERAHLLSRLIGARGNSLLRLDSPEGIDP